MTTMIGIDPGQAGGIVFLSDGAEAVAHKMPTTERDIWDLFKPVSKSNDIRLSGDVYAFIELVHSMPKQGVKSSFTFGTGYGGLRMALIAAGIPFETVAPQKWQQAMRCKSGGDKNVTKSRAQELFPDLKITHAIADALLIAAYGWGVRAGTPY
jgi:crossover junction endodeoxyribonuclease RuvC